MTVMQRNREHRREQNTIRFVVVILGIVITVLVWIDHRYTKNENKINQEQVKIGDLK